MDPYRINPRAVTMFRSDDGVLWETDAQAVDRNTIIAACADAIGRLKPRPESFEGYVQQDPVTVLAAKATILKIADRDGHLSKHWDIADPAKVASRGIIWRVIDEMSDSPIAKAWWRFTCMDDECREWEQPYFAINPGTGEDRCIA
jgi:hypothetical protein